MRKELARKSAVVSASRAQAERRALRGKIDKIIEISERNEVAQERLDEAEKALIGADSIKALIESMVKSGSDLFGLDFVMTVLDESALALFPEGYERIDERFDSARGHLSFVSSDRLSAIGAGLSGARLRGRLEFGDLDFFPAKFARSIKSEAILPLKIDGRLVGAVAFGSRSPKRFSEEDGTRIIDRLSRTVSLLVERFYLRAYAPIGGAVEVG